MAYDIIEDIKKYPILGLVPIAGLFWLILKKYPGEIVVTPPPSL